MNNRLRSGLFNGLLLFMMTLPCFCFSRSTDDLKSLIIAEYEKFKPIGPELNLKFGKVVFTTKIVSHVSGDNIDMMINADSIANMVNDRGKAFTEMFVKFVIAHELGHKMQYNYYKLNVIGHIRGEERVFIECFADVLSGFIIPQVYDQVEIRKLVENPDFNSTEYFQKNGTLAMEVLTAILAMDKKNMANDTHPTNLQRLQAVKQGMMMGKSFLTHFMIYINNPAYAALSELQQLEIVQELADLDKSLGYDASKGNRSLYWCQLEAIRIINETNSVCNKLIRYNTNISWDKRSSNPFVHFSFEILNRNSVTVNFAGKVFLEVIPRNDVKNVLNISTVDAITFEQQIQSGKSVMISGKLKWAASSAHMPHIVLPGDTRSLYWAFSAVDPKLDRKDISRFDANFNSWNDNSLDDINDFIMYLLPIRNNFQTVLKGIGTSESQDTIKLFRRFITYGPLFRSGNYEDQIIKINLSNHSLDFFTCRLFVSSKREETERHFAEIIEMLSEKHKNVFDKEHQGKLEEGDEIISFRDKTGPVLNITAEHWTGTNEYAIMLEVYSDQK